MLACGPKIEPWRRRAPRIVPAGEVLLENEFFVPNNDIGVGSRNRGSISHRRVPSVPTFSAAAIGQPSPRATGVPQPCCSCAGAEQHASEANTIVRMTRSMGNDLQKPGA